jgi:ribosomal protein S18 acetylase RimI-like enzyme
VEIRRARPLDADAIASVHERAWHAAYRHVFPHEALDAFRSDANRWRARLSAPPPRSAAFVAEDVAGVAGFVSLGKSRDSGGAGEVYAIYVDPDRWRSGVGAALMLRAEEELRAYGFPAATLWVLDNNPRARGFYESAGWEFDGETKTDTYLGVEVAEVRYGRMLA